MSSDSSARTLSLAAVGQALIKRDVLAEAGPETLALVERLRAADVAFTNLEGAIGGPGTGWPMKDKSVAALSPDVLDTLRRMGFGLLSLANNHASDLGPPGVLSTIAEARARGFTVAGTGPDAASAARAGIGTFAGRKVGLVAIDAGPWGEHVWASDAAAGRDTRPGVNRLTVKRRLQVPAAEFKRFGEIAEAAGHNRRIATRVGLGFQSPAPAGALDFFGLVIEPGDGVCERMQVDASDLDRHCATVAEAAPQVDLLVVYLHNHHWPADWMRPPGWMRDVASRLLAAGGDVFLSHGAPVLQGIELIDGKPAAYGLGNFVFHSSNQKVRAAEEVWRSGLLELHFTGRRLARLEISAVALGDAERHGDPSGNRDAPRFWTGASASAFLERWIARGDIPAGRWSVANGVARLSLG